MKKQNELLLESQLCFALYSTAKTVVQSYGPLLEKLGLTYLQYLVMLLLWEEDDVPLKALAEKLFLDSGTLTPLLKKLEALGLIRKERSEQDEREVRIRLTKEGRALRRQAEDIPRCMFQKTQLPAKELSRLKEELENLRQTLLQNS